MGKEPRTRLKIRERLGIFSLAVILSLVLAGISFMFTDIFSDIFFSFFKEDKKTKVIWVENKIKPTYNKGPGPTPANSPQR